MYRMMKYTMRVKCQDGETRSFEKTGFFISVDVLRHHLATHWNGKEGPCGGVYEYSETPEQAAANNQAPTLPDDFEYPVCASLWHGKERHQYHFVQ